MFSAAEEIIFASETKAWVRRVLLPGSDAASPRSPASSRRISLHRWTMVEDPRRPLLKTTAPLRELSTPIASNRPPASLTCGTRQWHHLFQGQQLTGGCGSMVFQAGYPALSLSYPANRRKNVYSLHRSIPSGWWRTGSKSSSLMNRNSSWVMATRDLVFGGKSTKGTRRLVWSTLSSIPASVMVWGCVSSRGVGSLCFLSPKTTVNTEVYIDLLDAYLLPSVDKRFADDDFVFQHDLAPAHRSYKTAKYLKEKRIDVLEWPCNSPDLNIIEFVWQKMKTRVQQVHLKTLEELKAVLREVWASFTQNELEEMV